ncbi:PA14 domain-containing protein [Acidipila sp. EB88]|uniref:PA14 domain-containing protein n=1 Tax=Acidipila sp. EB88 TaxID=2305226 RepID=UPI000F5F5E2D|nr:PA14 domain-containing protein [Acidipila sp. EB88]RRA49359.1 hypothetical protein D1Y84_14795 [Acidipila sp. EB88]
MQQLPWRSLLLMCACILPLASEAQNSAPGTTPTEQAGPDITQVPIVLKVTTREVIVDVVASDRRDESVPNLQASELAVFETGPDHQRKQQRITSIRYVAPLSEMSQPSTPATLHVRLGSGCAEDTTGHYELTYHVSTDELRDGEHSLLVTTPLPGIRLNYGLHYHVASIAKLTPSTQEPESVAEARLLQAACFHSNEPLSLPLLVHFVETQDANDLRFQITIPPAALPLASIAVDSRDIHLQYAACSFDQNGRALHFMHSSENRTLRSSEYVEASVHGFPSFVELPGTEHPPAVRFVVRDTQTGNIGSALIKTPYALKAGQLTPEEAAAEQSWNEHQTTRTDINFPPLGPIGSFGSIEPRAGAMCADVYELPAGMSRLPKYWSLDSVGSLYAYVLNVPHQQFWKTGGIPGVTRATEWFGIDYHGAFQVKEPGAYEFTVLADDGAKLYIDDELVVDADNLHNLETASGKVTLQPGWHTLHLPYFQGPPNAVALQLFVKKPGGSRELFDMREFGSTPGVGQE